MVKKKDKMVGTLKCPKCRKDVPVSFVSHAGGVTWEYKCSACAFVFKYHRAPDRISTSTLVGMI